MTETHSGPIATIASYVGTSEAALRLFYSILLAYPIAFAHRKYLYGKPPPLQHVFFIVSGLLLGFYNFGLGIIHSVINVVVVYIILKTIGGTLHSVIVTLCFNLLYLLTGYYFTETESYDICWTMPHCVLALRLSGLAFDLYDGSLPEDQLSKDSKKLSLRELPSIAEIAGYTYFPTSFLVGPQFPMRRYQDFVAGKLKSANQILPNCIEPGLKRLALGLVYLVIFTVGSAYYSDAYILGDKFAELCYPRRLLEIGIWGHLVLYKYISIWLVCEGACICIGLSYNGEDEKGNQFWDGCANVNVALFEFAQNFTYDYINSFNTNTNFWMLQYIYKRLRFLGNKYYSQLGVLVFLSFWHGLHSGYFVCFFMEFICVAMEKDLEGILQKNEVFLEYLNRPLQSKIKWVVLKLYTLIFMAPCVAPLHLLTYDRYLKLFNRTLWIAQIFWGTYFLYRPIVKKLLPPSRRTKKTE